MTRTLRSVHVLPSGNICATVVDEHLKLVRVVVPKRESDAASLCAIIAALLDARRAGLPRLGVTDGAELHHSEPT